MIDSLRQLTPQLSVASQITPADVVKLHAAGFRSVVCHRPDGEAGPEQPSFEDIARAARDLGMAVSHQPIVPGQVSDAQIQAFGDALASMPGPMLAYCRTGTRSTTVWALSQAKILPLSDILATAGSAGYDLHGLAPRLAQLHKA